MDAFIAEDWTTVPKLKILEIIESKLTEFMMFQVLEELTLLSNPFRLNASTIATELPDTLVKLVTEIDGKPSPSATDFQHLKKLKILDIYAYVDLDYKILSGLQSVEKSCEEYKTPRSHDLNITIEACFLSRVMIEAI